MGPHLVVCEHFSAGGGLPGEDPAPLRREGRAMLLALLADLRALDALPLAAVVRPALASALPAGVEALPGGSDPAQALRRALAEGGGWAWPIAPETRGTAARLARVAAAAGDGVVGTPADGVGHAARRLALLGRLERRGVPVPRTVAARTDGAARRALQAMGGPVVVKPGRGAGGAGTRRVEAGGGLADAREAAAAVDPELPPLVQRHVAGTAASVTVLAGADAALPLALHRQVVDFTPRARYRGGATPLRHRDAGRALRTAADAVAACGGLRGLVGVDLVLGGEGPVVLEINPRLTTSYLGLRRHLGSVPAAAALRAAGHPAAGRLRLPSSPGPVDGEPVRYGPDGGTPGDRSKERPDGVRATAAGARPDGSAQGTRDRGRTRRRGP